MKRHSFLLFALVSLLVCISCTKESLPGDENANGASRLTATVAETRTALNGSKITWKVGDQIVVNGVTSNAITSGDIKNGARSADFTFPAVINPTFYAVYPASAYVADSYADGKAAIVIPSYQTMGSQGFDPSTAIMVATGASTNLHFSHAVAYLKISFDTAVSTVEISALGAEMISGSFETAFDGKLTPVTGQAAGSVVISAASAMTGPWVVAVPAQTYKGLVISAVKADGSVMMRKNTATLDAIGGTLYDLGTAGFTANRTSYFVSPTGSGNGTSWDDAASISKLLARIKSKNANNYNFYMKEGTYGSSQGFTAECAMSMSSANPTKFAIYGGYPSGASGHSLTGRDVLNHPTVIDAEKARRILVINGAGIDITLNGLTFKNSKDDSNTNGNAIVAQSAASVVIEDCTFEDNENNPIRMSVSSSWKRCRFINNGTYTAGVGTVNAATSFENCFFQGNTGSDAGVFKLGKTTLTLRGNVFKGNTQGTWDGNSCTTESFGGGAVYLLDTESVLDSEDDTFLENRGGVGGAISAGSESQAKASAVVTIKNGYFKNNRAGRDPTSATGPIGGGAVYLNGGTATLTDCYFGENYVTNNNASWSGGGGILAQGSAYVLVTGSTFYKNRVAGSASAIYCINCESDKPVRLRDCIFDGASTQNAGSRGGALRTYGDNSRIYANRCVFKSHVVKAGYGSVAMVTGGGMAFCNCTFFNNKVTEDAIASTIYVNSTGPLILANCTFWDNNVGNASQTKGNAQVYFGKSSNPTILINNLIVNRRASAATDYALSGTKPTNLTSTDNVVSALDANWTGTTGMYSCAYNTNFGLSWSASQNLVVSNGNLGGYTRPASVSYSPIQTYGSRFYSWVTLAGFNKDGKGVTRTGTIYPGAYQGN